MVVLTSLRSAIAGLARNPVLFVAAGILALVQLPQFVAQAFDPLVAGLISIAFSLALVVLMPFFQAGLFGMAEEALSGRTRFGTFLSAGRAHYVSMLVAYLLLLAAVVAFGIVVLVVAALFLVFVLGSGGPLFENPATLAVGGVLAAAVAVVYLGVVFFVQFYGQAIVVDDVGAIDGYRRSVRSVRRNLLATFGYSLLAGVFGLLFGGLAALAAMLLTPEQATMVSLPTLSPGGTAAVAVLLVVLTTLSTAFFMTFSVAFYRGISSGEPDERAAPAAD